MIESNPSSQKTWKPHWFYASGAGEFPEGAEQRQPRIQRRFRMPGMRPNRNDPNMQAMLMKLAKGGTSSGLAGGSQPARVGGSPHMSVARSQGTSVVATPTRAGQKRRAKGEPRRETGKRPASSAVPELGKRVSVDPVTGPLEPWMNGELALRSYQEAAKRVLKVEVVEGMFTEEMGYNGYLKLSVAAQNIAAHGDFDRGKREHAVTFAELNRTTGEKAKVEEELELVRGRLEADMKKNTELLSSVNKLAADKRGLGTELSKTQKDLDEANRKIEAFASELRSCYDDVVKDYLGSAEY
ncbi:uncharacterized protein Pyn_18893 [Prunus yedoensis var. nudiflora]|uniref:Uncharacterized protein n=1 Tax=Prunus yedoensis var. nudiflora TaxID=2094558 RepID=A0A314YRW6_PRUYE|nr:uncharacterized protein Pyn_18893 [Prunus yedoensis var. nudiflora]